jgi:hypothetical protein
MIPYLLSITHCPLCASPIKNTPSFIAKEKLSCSEGGNGCWTLYRYKNPTKLDLFLRNKSKHQGIEYYFHISGEDIRLRGRYDFSHKKSQFPGEDISLARDQAISLIQDPSLLEKFFLLL